MKILNCVSLLLLWSSAGLAKINPNPFVIVDNCKDTPGTEVTLKNPPRAETTGVLPTCFGPSSAFLVQSYICKVKGISKCSSISDDDQVSIFSTISWANKNTSLINGQERPSEMPSSYTNITFAAGSGTRALVNSARAFSFKPEACYPVNKINNKFGSEKEFLDRMAQMNELYLHNRNSTEACESCLIESIRANLDVTIDDAGLRSALQKTTFEEFLYKIIFKDCSKNVAVSPPPVVEIYPKIGETVAKKAVIAKIGETITSDRPLLLEGICVLRKNENECEAAGKHSIAIKGYKECCRPGKDCRKLVQVQNSWGEDWQKKFNNGWVDAETLVNNIEEPIKPGVMSWYK